MSELFLKIVVMSISASWLVLAVLILRLVLKKAPKWMNVLLWGIVAIRLICPFTIESPVSMIPDSVGSGKFVSEWMDDYVGNVDIHHSNSVYYDAAIGAGREPIYDGEGGYYVVTKHNQLGEPATIKNTVVPVLSVMWVTGIAALVFYTFISFWRLRRKVSEAVIFRENIYLSENVCSPFVLGILKPKIYLPFKMDDQNLEHIIAHEKAHIRRKDHWWKPFGFLLLTLHWFNPLMWIAYALLCRDIELACDEKVIKELGNEQRADYTQALLACSVNRRMIAACPLAFGEIGVKERVKNVLNYKKPAFWVIVVAVVACAVVTVCFATNPVTAEPNTPNAERPTLLMDGAVYVDPYMPVSVLPYGYQSAGKLTNEQANNTGLEGIEYFVHPSETEDFYTYQECGTPISIDTVDSTKRQWAYVRWIQAGTNAVDGRKMTLDDVVMLSRNGNALTWSDFERYQGQEVGSGLYIMCYKIDQLFDVLVGGVPKETPMYIELRVHNEAEDHIDIRTGDVPSFIEAHRNDALKVDELSAALNKLEYQPFTCDGLPEYKLYDTDGTVYSINFSEKWVWRGNSEQAELSDELIRLLRESGVLVAGEKPVETHPDETINQTEAQEIALNECRVNYDYIKAEFNTDKDVWEIGFWENNAAVAAQTIVVDTTGCVLSVYYAE